MDRSAKLSLWFLLAPNGKCGESDVAGEKLHKTYIQCCDADKKDFGMQQTVILESDAAKSDLGQKPQCTVV